MLCVAALAMLFAAPTTRAQDEFVRSVNQLYKDIRPERRSDQVLLPLLAKMDPPPRVVGTIDEASVLPASSKDFAGAASWAQGPNQQAVLAALAQVTREPDWQKGYAFGQPYGADAVDPEMIRIKQYTELGDPPTLAAAQHLYMPSLDRLGCLVNVEATRLAAAGKPKEAVDLMINWVYFARQMVDRAFAREVLWGFRQMAQGFERVRDIAYLDMGGAKAIGTDHILGFLGRLAESGYTDLARMNYPIADRAGTEQVLARVYPGGPLVDERVFAPTMARLGTSERPLRLFSESSRWRSAAGAQGDGDQAKKLARGIYEDWHSRWRSGWFDARQSLVTEWSKLDRTTYAAIAQSTPDMGELQDARQIVKVEAQGTRAALALVGYYYIHGTHATSYSAVRPLWLKNLEIDPFSREVVSGPRAWMGYLVPERDTPKDAQGRDVPYEIDVVTNDPANPLAQRFKSDTFILYSVGSNAAPEQAKRIQNTAKQMAVPADYLIFPPVLSIRRQQMINLGQFN